MKPAPASVRRAKDRIREIMQRGLGQNIHRVIAQINVFTRGWFGYFRLSSVKHAFASLEAMDPATLAQDTVGTVEAAEDALSETGCTWSGGGTGAQGHRHRARSLVECRGLAHARRCP